MQTNGFGTSGVHQSHAYGHYEALEHGTGYPLINEAFSQYINIATAKNTNQGVSK
jgi:hypothetical protein